MKGMIRELVVSNLIEPLLPESAGVGTGKIVDSCQDFKEVDEKGNSLGVHTGASRQIDIIVYDKDLLQSANWGTSLGWYPVESCIFAIEIKTKLNLEELAKTLHCAKSVRRLSALPRNHFGLAQINGTNLYGLSTPAVPSPVPQFGLFAFDTILSPDSTQDDFDRVPTDYYSSAELEKLAISWSKIPKASPGLLAKYGWTDFCVAGRSFRYLEQHQGGWGFRKVDPGIDHFDVLGFLLRIVNTVNHYRAYPGYIDISPYFVDGLRPPKVVMRDDIPVFAP